MPRAFYLGGSNLGRRLGSSGQIMDGCGMERRLPARYPPFLASVMRLACWTVAAALLTAVGLPAQADEEEYDSAPELGPPRLPASDVIKSSRSLGRFRQADFPVDGSRIDALQGAGTWVPSRWETLPQKSRDGTFRVNLGDEVAIGDVVRQQAELTWVKNSLTVPLGVSSYATVSPNGRLVAIEQAIIVVEAGGVRAYEFPVGSGYSRVERWSADGMSAIVASADCPFDCADTDLTEYFRVDFKLPGAATSVNEHGCTVADVANVRWAPSNGQDSVVAQVRIGTRLKVRRKKDGWSWVIADTRNGPLRGWVKDTAIVRDCLSHRELLNKAAAARATGNLVDAVTWAERAFVMERGDAATQKLLRGLYAEAGETRKVELLESALRGPVFLAQCLLEPKASKSGQVALLAQFNRPAGLVLLVPDASNPVTEEQINRARAAASVEVWSSSSASLGGGGTPFARARWGMVRGRRMVVMGTCNRPDELFVSAPLAPPAVVPPTETLLGGPKVLKSVTFVETPALGMLVSGQLEAGSGRKLVILAPGRHERVEVLLVR